MFSQVLLDLGLRPAILSIGAADAARSTPTELTELLASCGYGEMHAPAVANFTFSVWRLHGQAELGATALGSILADSVFSDRCPRYP